MENSCVYAFLVKRKSERKFLALWAIQSKKGVERASFNEECELGIRCISMPVYDYTGHPLAALSVFSSSEVFTDDYLKENIIPALSAAAKEISWRLGYSE